MSDILEIIKTRRSVRKYKSDMVPTDIIDKIVEARASIMVLASLKRDVISPVRREPKKLMGKERTFLI